MKPDKVVFRVDATYHLTIQEGEIVRRGQKFCEGPHIEAECICPVSGIVRRIRFDPERHEFAISVSKAGTG